MSTRTERVIGAIAVGGALLFAGAVFVWRVVFDDAWWSLPKLPRMAQWEAFGIYSWVVPCSVIAIAGVLIVAAIRRRGGGIAPSLAVVVSVSTAAFYLPFWFMRDRHVDRVRGVVEEPVHTMQAMVAMVILTLALSAVFVASSCLRRTPRTVHRHALAFAVVFNAVLLHLTWLQMFIPFANRWQPVAWQRPDLLVTVRPCRNAVLWIVVKSGKAEDIGTIDDLWLHFADPRNGGAITPAISVSGTWSLDYYWLNAIDRRAMRVRSDDPAVVECDSHVRRERVTPAAWHKLGFEW